MKEDPNEYQIYFQNSFMQALQEKMKDTYSLYEKNILNRIPELFELNKHTIEDEPSRNHLQTVSMVIAAFEQLIKIYSLEESLDIIKYAFVDSVSFITYETQKFLDNSEDPFRDIVTISKQKEKEYGKTFEFYRRQDNDNAYLLEVKKCFYCKILKLNNRKELTPIFCEFDTTWMNAINPKKHLFRFDRPETIGTGGDICKFYFTKTEPQ